MSNIKLWQELDEYKDEEDLYAEDDLPADDKGGDYFDELSDEYAKDEETVICPQCGTLIEDLFYDYISCDICGWVDEK